MYRAVAQKLSRGQRCEAATALLEAGPWMWPEPSSPHFRTACAWTHLAGPPPPTVGTAWVVTVEDATVTLWRLATAGVPLISPYRGKLDVTAGEAVATARGATLPHLPLLWHATSAKALPDVVVEHVCTVQQHTWTEVLSRPDTIAGRSLAAATALAQASRLLETPVDAGVVVSADLDQDGNLHPVGGLAIKAAAIARLLPGAALWTATGGAPLPEGVDAARQVDELRGLFRVAFPDTETLVARRLEAVAPCILLTSMESIILGRQTCGLGWRPFQTLAATASARLEPSDPDTATFFRMLYHVAGRHLGDRAPMPSIPWAAIDALPPERALRWYAHLAQHAADTGYPPPADCARIGDFLTEISPALRHQGHRRVAGALSRARLLTGSLPDALRVQRELAIETAEAGAEGEVSFPLSMWLRLAGACNDPAAFDAALVFRRQRSLMLEATPGDGTQFLDHAQGFSAALLGRGGDLPASVGAGDVAKMQLRAGGARIVGMAALVAGRVQDAEQQLRALLRRAEDLSKHASRENQNLRVVLRYTLLLAVDFVAAGVSLPPDVARVHALVDCAVATTTGPPDAAAPAPSAPSPRAVRPDLHALLALFERVEREPMRRVRQTEAAAGHPDDARFADAVRRRYPY